MTIARKGLKVKIQVMGQANAVGPTSIEDSFLQFTNAQPARINEILF